jgi:hypothetical protein
LARQGRQVATAFAGGFQCGALRQASAAQPQAAHRAAPIAATPADFRQPNASAPPKWPGPGLRRRKRVRRLCCDRPPSTRLCGHNRRSPLALRTRGFRRGRRRRYPLPDRTPSRPPHDQGATRLFRPVPALVAVYPKVAAPDRRDLYPATYICGIDGEPMQEADRRFGAGTSRPSRTACTAR